MQARVELEAQQRIDEAHMEYVSSFAPQHNFSKFRCALSNQLHFLFLHDLLFLVWAPRPTNLKKLTQLLVIGHT